MNKEDWKSLLVLFLLLVLFAAVLTLKVVLQTN